MNTLEAIQARHSVRDFLSKPVPRDIVMKILQAATRSPSGGNGQPWEIFVASGVTLENMRAAYQERAQARAGGPSLYAVERPPLPLNRMSCGKNWTFPTISIL